MRESHRQTNNVLIRVDHESDTDSTDSVIRGSSGLTTTSADKPIDGPEARRGHYRGITFEEILPPQFISNAPSPTVEPKRGPIRRSNQPANANAPPAASEPVRRSYPPAKSSDSKSNSRIRNTARALARGLSIMKKRDSQGYENVR